MEQKIIVQKISSAKPGPTIAVIGGVHGDELIGVKAIEQIIPTLKPVCGTVIFIIANPPAIAAKRRFIDANLNRSLINPTNSKTAEGRLASQLMPILDICDAMLDLHASIGDEPPFAICETSALPIAERLPVDIVSTGWATAEPGSTDAYMYNQGKPAVCVECGNRNQWQKNLPLAIMTIKAFLAYYGLVDVPLSPIRSQQIVAVQYAVSKNTADFRFIRSFSGFEKLIPGEVIAQDGPVIYRAPKYASCIIFPWAETPIGTEAFLIGAKTGDFS